MISTPHLDLTLCKDKRIPHADPKRKYVILFIENYVDGIGDFMHGLSFAKELKELLSDKGYSICAVVSTVKDKPHDIDAPSTKRAASVKNMLESGTHDFDKWYLYEGVFPRVDSTDWINSPERRELREILSQAAIALEISYRFPLEPIKEFVPKNVEIVKCFQYGSMGPSALKTDMNVFTNAPMGLPQEGQMAYGIKLYEPCINESTRIARLLAIGERERNLNFVSHLLQKENPTVEDAAHYFSTHHFMPGYIQNIPYTIAFILVQVLRNLDINGNLEKSCDFLIPQNVVDESLIKFFLGKIGIKRR